MKCILTTIAILGLTAVPALADVTGKWKTQTNDEGQFLIVDIKQCGSSICGTAVGAESDNNELIGKPIIKDMTSDGGDAYSGGQIYAPSQSRWVKGKLSLTSSNALSVSGCILGGTVCRTQNWTRQ